MPKEQSIKNKNKNSKQGVVVSLTSGENTIKVELERQFKHPVYEKQIKRNKKYLVDTKGLDVSDVKIGDIVHIEEVKPISKLKRWRLVK